MNQDADYLRTRLPKDKACEAHHAMRCYVCSLPGVWRSDDPNCLSMFNKKGCQTYRVWHLHSATCKNRLNEATAIKYLALRLNRVRRRSFVLVDRDGRERYAGWGHAVLPEEKYLGFRYHVEGLDGCLEPDDVVRYVFNNKLYIEPAVPGDWEPAIVVSTRVGRFAAKYAYEGSCMDWGYQDVLAQQRRTHTSAARKAGAVIRSNITPLPKQRKWNDNERDAPLVYTGTWSKGMVAKATGRN